MIHRRQFVGGCLGFASAAVCSRHAKGRVNVYSLVERIDEAISRATGFFVQRQDADGSWRSQLYGPFKDGPSLTSLIAATLAGRSNDSVGHAAAQRALQYMNSLVQADGSIDAGPSGVTYPVYVAAGAIVALSRIDAQRHTGTCEAWLRFLRERQLTEELGWQPGDLGYGGWSYAPFAPRPLDGKPPSPLAAPNLSATAFALDALRAAGISQDDPSIQKARIFVARCQNWNEETRAREPEFDDGGFFFILNDPVRNKAGQAGTDRHGRMRYSSYGSATADGLRALISCGLTHHDLRALAARHWLTTHFSPAKHPGHYTASQEHLRPAVYFYYCAAAAEAFTHTDKLWSRERNCGFQWAKLLAAAVLERQLPDGSWINAAVDVREDDPLVATPLAMQALKSCLASILTIR